MIAGAVGGRGGGVLNSSTALASAFADSTIDDIGSVEDIRVWIVGWITVADLAMLSVEVVSF